MWPVKNAVRADQDDAVAERLNIAHVERGEGASLSRNVSICIVSWNTREVLRNCLQSLYQWIAGVTFEIIVVDNASEDGSSEMIATDFPDVRLIRNEENYGFARGCNQGMSAARGRHYLLLNSDTWLTEDAVTRLSASLDACPEAGAIGCLLRWPDGRIQPSCGWFPTVFGTLIQGLTPRALFDKVLGTRGRFAPPFLSYRKHLKPLEVDWIVGACIMVRRETVDQVGMIDSDIFMFGEESEWCFRMKKAGWRVLYTPETQVVHIGCASWNLGEGARVHAVLASQQFFFRKYFGRGSAARYRGAVLVNALVKSVIWRLLAMVWPSKRAMLSDVANWHRHALTWCLRHPSGRMITADDIARGPRVAARSARGGTVL